MSSEVMTEGSDNYLLSKSSTGSFLERPRHKSLARTHRVRKRSQNPEVKAKTRSLGEASQLPLSLPLVLDVPVRLNNAGLTEVSPELSKPTKIDNNNQIEGKLSPAPNSSSIFYNPPEIVIASNTGEFLPVSEANDPICPCCGPSGSDVESTDDNQNRRLSSQESLDVPTFQGDREQTAKAKHKRGFVLRELLDTERKYVEDITVLVNGFMEVISTMELPDSLKGREKIVFGNIRAILNFHRDKFLPELEKVYDNPQKIGSLFTKYEKQLRLYVTYCENKPRSEYLVAEHPSTFHKLASKVGKKLQISDYLIKPVQRIMKYQLLLKDILKYTEKIHESTMTLHRAMDVMHRVPKAANNMMQVGRLQGFEAKISVHGTVLLQDTLPVAVFNLNKPANRKYKEKRVFLFEQIFIISDLCESATKGHYYKFRDSIKLSDLRLVQKVFEESTSFILSNVKHAETDYYLKAPSVDVKEEWTVEIQRLIDKQRDFLLVLEDPLSGLRLSPNRTQQERPSRAVSDRPDKCPRGCSQKNNDGKDRRTIH
ncbi:rho guanine nucleotide exchange factor 25-like [Watersipora subatra]|uniref:rho guanine nucleotide exchange factor 25-like n=1 Tax=Watersipora subatra TaxID=2589382 RepID=UPI00355C8D72